MGMAAPTSGASVGCRKNGGEIGGRRGGMTKGGSNDAFTFQNYFNSCKGSPCIGRMATSERQYFLSSESLAAPVQHFPLRKQTVMPSQ